MGTRQLRLSAPTVAILSAYLGQQVQLVLLTGNVMAGRLLAVDPAGAVLQLRLSDRSGERSVPVAAVRELISDREANQ